MASLNPSLQALAPKLQDDIEIIKEKFDLSLFPNVEVQLNATSAMWKY